MGEVDAVDVVALYRRAVDEFGTRVHVVEDDEWGQPTPCTGWDVRALVNHVVGEDAWAVPLLAGSTIQEVGDRLDGDLLGDDPREVWSRTALEALAAVGRPLVLESVVHVSFGDISGREYLSQLIVDHVVHAWDLARGVAADEWLDPELVAFSLATIEPHAEQWRAAGAFGPPIEVRPGADPQLRLLALTGRRA